MLSSPPIPPLTGNRLRGAGSPQRIPPPPRHQIRPFLLPGCLRNQHRLPMPGQHILAHRRHLLPIFGSPKRDNGIHPTAYAASDFLREQTPPKPELFGAADTGVQADVRATTADSSSNRSLRRCDLPLASDPDPTIGRHPAQSGHRDPACGMKRHMPPMIRHCGGEGITQRDNGNTGPEP